MAPGQRWTSKHFLWRRKILVGLTPKTGNVTKETADVFGQVKDALKRAGAPIPMNDVWIAAQAIETGSVLITYDRHFSKVPGLRLWDILD